MYNKDYLEEKSKVNIDILDEIDSTNEEAKRRIKDGASADFVLVARKQTAGKGRKGRSFYSPKDTGIYLTFTHFTDEAAEDVLKVTVATSVIAAKTIKDTLNINCGIKWVNDLYHNGKKVSGTLCEYIFKGTYENEQNAVIVGIGINLSTEDFPEEISDKAGSLTANNDNIFYDEIVSGISNGLNSFFKDCNLNYYLPLYKELSIVLGKEVELSDALGVAGRGRVIDFDDNGAIILETKNGEKKTFDSGEISLFMI
ncbi:MAG: biotin--[acetyl-CoA-carboxylase] ligase [Lachnospiraceae bacterium]|nr:biotin--[acetyl-CoA-carboxylase] ligase [Lachnospiraceae bacterium]